MSAPMVRAILAGNKTQTRRVVKPRKDRDFGCELATCEIAGEVNGGDCRLCPYGHPGDRLWVRETWLPDPPIDGWGGDVSWQDERRIDGVPAHYRKPEHCIFAASWGDPGLRWRPSIHMPRWASRILLEVTSVRVERLQDISEEDAIAEGTAYLGRAYQGARTPSDNRDHFCALWESINGAESWEQNPWVWCVGFKRVTP